MIPSPPIVWQHVTQLVPRTLEKSVSEQERGAEKCNWHEEFRYLVLAAQREGNRLVPEVLQVITLICQ